MYLLLPHKGQWALGRLRLSAGSVRGGARHVRLFARLRIAVQPQQLCQCRIPVRLWNIIYTRMQTHSPSIVSPSGSCCCHWSRCCQRKPCRATAPPCHFYCYCPCSCQYREAHVNAKAKAKTKAKAKAKAKANFPMQIWIPLLANMDTLCASLSSHAASCIDIGSLPVQPVDRNAVESHYVEFFTRRKICAGALLGLSRFVWLSLASGKC